MSKSKALIVVTSHSLLGATGKTTGFNLSELTHSLFEFERVGISADIMSLNGGAAPLDENSRDLSDPINRDYIERKTFQYKIANTLAPQQVHADTYGALVLVGGYGALWDFPEHFALQKLIQGIYEDNGIVGAINQGTAALINVHLKDGTPLLREKKVTGTSDREVMASGLATGLPLFPESEMTKRGALFSSKENWRKYNVMDGRLFTGQNTASAQAVGEAVRRALIQAQNLRPSATYY